MWIFNPDGLTIMSPAGDTILVQDKSKVCPNLRTNYQGVETDDCSFFDVQSDGHRYVWAANHDDSPHKIDVFDINTGAYAGYAPTCSTPLDLVSLDPLTLAADFGCHLKLPFTSELPPSPPGDVGSLRIQVRRLGW